MPRQFSGLCLPAVLALATGCFGTSALYAEDKPVAKPAVDVARIPTVKLILGKETQTFDLGVVRAEDRIERTVNVINAVGGPVHIKRVVACCGAAFKSMSQMDLAPGESAVLTLKIRTISDSARHAFSVWFESEVEGKPMTFEVTGILETKPVLEFAGAQPADGWDAARLDFGPLDLQRTPTEFAIGVTKGGYPTKWNHLTVESDCPLVTPKVESVAENKWRIRCAVDPATPIGLLTANLKIRFFDGDQDANYLLLRQVGGLITGPVRAMPRSWLVGQVVAGEHVDQVVKFISTSGENVAPKVVDAVESGHMSVLSGQNAPDRVTLRYRADNKLGPDAGETQVRVETSKGTYNVRIPYVALVVDKVKTAKETADSEKSHEDHPAKARRP